MTLRVKDIIIYPIKSLGGISVDSAVAEKEGFKFDRRWMLVDDSGRFLSQREHHKMALFSSTLNEDHLVVRYAEDQIEIPFKLHSNQLEDVSIWEHDVQAVPVDTQINAWFSDYLQQSCKLVKMTSATNRVKTFQKEPFKSNVSFADGYPYLILGTASMDKLNTKLDAPLEINRFRPNIVVQTDSPHEEDTWEDVSINDAIFKVVKPCPRCVVTTIDQSSGIAGKEPLKTLAGYRKKDNQILFGANTILLSPGTVNKGDRIYLL